MTPIITRKLHHIKLFYLPGGGGNWVNYLLWCWVNNKIIPGEHAHFGQDVLWPIEQTYGGIVALAHHDSDWHDSDIVLGSQKMFYNWWLMNQIKNSPGLIFNSKQIGPLADLVDNFFDIGYNLDWTLIVENPRKFLQQLSSFLPFEIKYTPLVRHAIYQYLQSSYPKEFQGDGYRTAGVFDKEIEKITRLYTDSTLPMAERQQQAWDLFDCQWIRWDGR